MRTYQTTVREGEDMGPIDWSHPVATGKPDIWREAEKNPENFTFGEYGRRIIKLCMYDGWPYWTPTPAVAFEGPLGWEWAFFNNYGASIHPRKQAMAIKEEVA